MGRFPKSAAWLTRSAAVVIRRRRRFFARPGAGEGWQADLLFAYFYAA
jgi:hypothetical protein